MTVKIHGKDYVEVNVRLKEFWTDYPDGAILTGIIKVDDNFVLMKAEVKKKSDSMKVDATGHAFENRDASIVNSTLKVSKINLTSYVENCETSAIGRALGILGYGLDTSVATAEEVTQAIDQQGASSGSSHQHPNEIEMSKPQKEYIGKLLKGKGVTEADLLKELKINKSVDDFSKNDASRAIKYLLDYVKGMADMPPDRSADDIPF